MVVVPKQDLIDYLMNQLYYLGDDDIDFFLPQLCTLLVVRGEELSKQLECFILHKCMKSIDFAIKCFWNLHAMQFYSKVDAQRDRCDELRQNLEVKSLYKLQTANCTHSSPRSYPRTTRR